MQVAAPPAEKRGPILPKEHGAWAMLLIPLTVGLAVAGRWGLEGPLFLGACLALYSARQPLTLLAKALKDPSEVRGRAQPLLWLVVYGALGLAFGLPLLYPYGRWLLLPWAGLFLAFTAVHIYLRKLRLDRTVPGELATIAGLALTAPGAYYVAKGLEPTALYLWALTTLYSGASVFYVRMKLRQRSLRRPAQGLGERLDLGKANIIYQAFLVPVLAILAAWGQVPPLVPLAFVPLLAKVANGILRGGPQVNIKQVGWTEVAHSIAFTFLLIGTYLAGPRP